MEQQEIYKKALEIFQAKDQSAAQRFISEHFGDDADLNIVKCDQCGEILALVVNILSKGLTGGDTLTNLAIYKHIREHPDHGTDIYGYSHGVGLPIGHTLDVVIRSMAKRFNMTLEEALDKRIAYLEAKQ